MKNITYSLLLFLLACFFYLSNINEIKAQPDTSGVDSTPIVLISDTLKLVAEKEPDAIKKDSVVVDTAKSKGIRETITEGPPSLDNVISFGKIFWAAVFLAFGYFFIKLIVKSLEIWAEKSSSRRGSIKGIIPVVKIFGWLFLGFVVVQGVFKPPMETLIAFTASAGVAIGFASQDILQNIFGGIVILADRPFNVGDKIEVGSTYGEVVSIGLRSTRILTADDSVVSMPNGKLMNEAVSNSNTGEANCQVVAEIYLPIDVDTVRAREIALESAKVSKYIYLDKPVVALFFNEVKQRRSYLKMRLKAYVLDTRYEFAFKSDMTEIVVRELLNHKVISREDLM